jgi:hypothetical protein
MIRMRWRALDWTEITQLGLYHQDCAYAASASSPFFPLVGWRRVGGMDHVSRENVHQRNHTDLSLTLQ